MRGNAKIPFACAALILFASAAPCPQRTQKKLRSPLVFEARFLSDHVRVGQAVYLKLRLTNIGNENVLVKRRFRLNDTVSLVIRGLAGQKASWCGILPDFADLKGDFALIAPGSHVESLMRVTCDKQEKPTWGYEFPGPGEYLLTASYELPYPMSVLKKAAGSAVVVKGPVMAEPIHLTLLP